MELSNDPLVSWVVTYSGDLQQPTYIGVIGYNLFTKFHGHPSHVPRRFPQSFPRNP